MHTFVLFFAGLLFCSIKAESGAEELYQRSRLSIGLQQKNQFAVEDRSLSSIDVIVFENFITQFPCGWPDAGIPPLAPYTKEQIVFELKETFVEIFAKVKHFRIEGLDKVLINKFIINYAFSQKVKFDLVFPKIVITGILLNGTLIDFKDDYGIKVQYNNTGDFELILEDIKFQGQFKYTIPFIFGSIKIFKFFGSITLGNAIYRFNGIVDEDKSKQLLDEEIADILVKAVNLNQNRISAKIEDDLISYLNRKLKGYKIWSVIKLVFSNLGNTCYPAGDKWISNLK